MLHFGVFGGPFGGETFHFSSLFHHPGPQGRQKGPRVRPRPENDTKMIPQGPQNKPKCYYFGPLSASFFAMLSPVASPNEEPRKKSASVPSSFLFRQQSAPQAEYQPEALRVRPWKKNGGRFPLLSSRKGSFPQAEYQTGRRSQLAGTSSQPRHSAVAGFAAGSWIPSSSRV